MYAWVSIEVSGGSQSSGVISSRVPKVFGAYGGSGGAVRRCQHRWPARMASIRNASGFDPDRRSKVLDNSHSGYNSQSIACQRMQGSPSLAMLRFRLSRSHSRRHQPLCDTTNLFRADKGKRSNSFDSTECRLLGAHDMWIDMGNSNVVCFPK